MANGTPTGPVGEDPQGELEERVLRLERKMTEAVERLREHLQGCPAAHDEDRDRAAALAEATR